MNSIEKHIRKKLQQYTEISYVSQYMAPSLRGTFEHATKPKLSAVLIMLVPHNNSFDILYVQRTQNLHDKHSGQISFPGGGYSKQDSSLCDTAVRETFEEIGVLVNSNCIVGKLSEHFVPISNYIIHPYVAILSNAPHTFILQTSEIERVIAVPIEFVQDTSHIRTKQVEYQNTIVTIPYYAWEQFEIWGVTAMITEEFVECILR
jgi:8-oxo-dGTP pyrophosphatase MutT (NUDIX family)